MSWTSPRTGYGSGISEYDAARLNKLRSILGERYEISWARADKTGYHAEIVEGDRETVYNLDATDIEHLCAFALREIFNDVNSGSRTTRTASETIPLEVEVKANTEDFEAKMKAVGETLKALKKAYERTMK